MIKNLLSNELQKLTHLQYTNDDSIHFMRYDKSLKEDGTELLSLNIDTHTFDRYDDFEMHPAMLSDSFEHEIISNLIPQLTPTDNQILQKIYDTRFVGDKLQMISVLVNMIHNDHMQKTRMAGECIIVCDPLMHVLLTSSKITENPMVTLAQSFNISNQILIGLSREHTGGCFVGVHSILSTYDKTTVSYNMFLNDVDQYFTLLDVDYTKLI